MTLKDIEDFLTRTIVVAFGSLALATVLLAIFSPH
jgi:hypothetical protein